MALKTSVDISPFQCVSIKQMQAFDCIIIELNLAA